MGGIFPALIRVDTADFPPHRFDQGGTRGLCWGARAHQVMLHTLHFPPLPKGTFPISPFFPLPFDRYLTALPPASR